MEYGEKNTLYATSGQFTKLDGTTYVGPYHIMGQGIPMTEATHTPASVALIPMQQKQTKESNTLSTPDLNTTLNENETIYDLIPIVINKPPVIIRSVAEASIPPIKPYAAADASGDFMYQFDDGSVRVHKDTTIMLRAEAVQPNTLNVENGILEYKESTAELVYSWTFDGESVGGLDTDFFSGASRNISGNEIIITRIQPKYAGTYTCTVSNDIGSTDAGSMTLEVYNSSIDSFFYQNLIRNGNGADDTSGWESINEGFIASQLDNINTEIQKSIVVDPLNEPFGWTTEMFTPRPYQLNYGELRPESSPEAINNMVNTNLELSTYFTRIPYTYTVNGNIPIIRAYQDIDLSGELEAHIKGAIYGVEGLRGVLCAYIGNAIFNYQLTDEFVVISDRNDPSAYYLGAPRVSAENFSKAGPGYVAEKVTVTLQEYANNQPLQSNIISTDSSGIRTEKGILTISDPWTTRLPKYKGQVYYQGDRGLTVPDRPSLGDSRDAHLFVADELMPNLQDRYTFGQHAEFNKRIIERLDPRTNKIRITINIEAPDLGIMLRERGGFELPSVSNNLKLWETLPWMTTWPSRSFEAKNTDGFPNEDSAYSQLKNDIQIESTDIFQKIPQIGESRALVSGLTFALVPIYKNRTQITDNEINTIFAETENFTLDDSSPIVMNLPPYNALQELNEKQIQLAIGNEQSSVPAKYRLNEDKRVEDSRTFYPLDFGTVLTGPAQSVLNSFAVTQQLVETNKSITISATIVSYHNDGNNSLIEFAVYEFLPDGTIRTDLSSNGMIGDIVYPQGVNNSNKVTKKQNYTTNITKDILASDLVIGNYYQIAARADVNKTNHNHRLLANQSFMRVELGK